MTAVRWEVVIRTALEEEIHNIVAEEIAAAQSRVADRINDKLAELTIRCMRQFEIQNDQGRIVIDVRNNTKPTT